MDLASQKDPLMRSYTLESVLTSFGLPMPVSRAEAVASVFLAFNKNNEREGEAGTIL
jgi:hypothetical protein